MIRQAKSLSSAHPPADPTHNQVVISHYLVQSPSLRTSVRDAWTEVGCYNNKVNQQPPAQGILMPRAPVDTPVFEHGVRYGQIVASTEVQQQNTTRVQINRAFPGLNVLAHMCVEVPQQSNRVPQVGALSSPPLLPRDPLVHWGEVKHVAVKLWGKRQARTSPPPPPPLTAGNARKF